MAYGRIFIGSANESKDIAEKVAGALGQAGQEPIRWWHAFRAGDITIDRILEIAEHVDGAVFLSTSTDRTWYRGKETISPRDNVILEYGVFVSRLGLKATMLVGDPDTRLPTDIGGVTWQQIMRNDIPGLCALVVEHFQNVFSNSRRSYARQAIRIAADPELLGIFAGGNIPHDWHSRALYLGLEGARGWLALVEEESYKPSARKHKITEAVREAMANLRI